MTWRAISDGRRVLRVPKKPSQEDILAVGTLLVEAKFSAEPKSPQILLDWRPKDGWPRSLTAAISADGVVVITHRQLDAARVIRCALPGIAPSNTMRLTLNWHAPERIGLLTVENLTTGEQAQNASENPIPWTAADVADLVRSGGRHRRDATPSLIAVSDVIEPVGVIGGLVLGTLIDTMAGPKPVEALEPGDIVQTSEHGMQPIRGVFTYEAPAAGRFAPSLLPSPFFGLEHDLLTAPDHRILISGADAEYLFGSDEVLVKAHHLAKITSHSRAPQTETVRYAYVLLDAHVCLSVCGGAWAESLFLGHMSQDVCRHAMSLMADVPPDDLPVHTKIAGTQLRAYEAAVLVSSLCA